MATLKVKLTESPIGYPKDQKDALKALGLGKMHRERELPDSPAVRGNINKVIHLVTVVEDSRVATGAKPRQEDKQ